MKGVVFTGNRTLEIRNFTDPTPGPRDVILEIKLLECAEVTSTDTAPNSHQVTPRQGLRWGMNQ